MKQGSSPFGIWPILHILRYLAATLDYSPKILFDNDMSSLFADSLVSLLFPGGYNSFMRPFGF